MFDLPAGMFDLPAGMFDLPSGMFDLPAGMFDLPSGMFDLPAGIFDLPTGILRRPSNFFIGKVMMNHPFFVYGTLKPGEPNYARFLNGRTAGEGPASFAGALYTHGPYPYLVTEADLAAPDERVSGAVISVADADYPAILAQLDSLEGYSEGGTDNMYERLLVTVEAADGPRAAWLYVAGADALAQIRAGELRKVPGGNWQSDPAHISFWSDQ
jgi:gamma-glutamylcyclotransferase (GGCT)/AIG2-like uncharacterized protein YtfP